MNRILLPLLLLVPVITAGCDLLGEDDDTTLVTAGVYVANQGNFSDNNGTVTVYDPATGTAQVEAVGNLGSIVQSAVIHDGRLYVMSNTGGRVDVFDAETLARTGQVEGLISPRYFAPVGDDKAYVTNLFGDPATFSGGVVTVVDLEGLTTTGEITVGDNPEGIVVVGERAYVANHAFGSGTTLSVIDTRTDAVVQTVDADCDGPRTLLVDDDDEVWVFCTGSFMGENDGAVRVLRGDTGEIVARHDLGGKVQTLGPGQDAFLSTDADEAYVVVDGHSVIRFDTKTNQRSATIGPLEGDTIGAVAYDARNERLYLGRVPGFTESGAVTIHDRSGAEIGRFTAGVAPTYITFREASR